jgi:hypothetical protein
MDLFDFRTLGALVESEESRRAVAKGPRLELAAKHHIGSLHRTVSHTSHAYNARRRVEKIEFAELN